MGLRVSVKTFASDSVFFMFDFFFFGLRVDTELRDRDLVFALLKLDCYFGLSDAQL